MQQVTRKQTPAQGSDGVPAFIVLGTIQGTAHEAVLTLLEQAGLSPQDAAAAESLSRGVLASSGRGQDAPARLPVLPPDAAAGFGHPHRWLEQVSGSHVLFLYDRPEVVVARAMEAGEGPAEPLQRWCDAVEKVLDLFRHNRRRVTLAEAQAAQADPSRFIQALEQRLHVRLGIPAQRPEEGEGHPDPVHEAIAALAVHQAERVQELYAELEASSLPLSDATGALQPDVERVHEGYQEQLAAADKAQELEQLHSQLHHAREELEGYRRELKSAKQENQSLQSRVAEAEDKLPRLDELKRENELMLTQLHQVQEELESYHLESSTAKEEKARLQAELEAANEKVQALEQTGQRLTQVQQEAEEHRRYAESLAGEKEQLQARLTKAEEQRPRLDELERENELLLTQLHQVQEELEAYYLESRKAQDELQKVYNSTSWKVTRPLRAVVLLARGKRRHTRRKS